MLSEKYETGLVQDFISCMAALESQGNQEEIE